MNFPVKPTLRKSKRKQKSIGKFGVAYSRNYQQIKSGGQNKEKETQTHSEKIIEQIRQKNAAKRRKKPKVNPKLKEPPNA
jgi:hypothetical protein